MWSEISVLTDEMIGSAAGPGVWGFGINSKLIRFYKDVRIVGVQSTFLCIDANGIWDAVVYMVIQQRTDKGQATNTFGGSLYYWSVRVGTNVNNFCSIDIPANHDVTIIGSCSFFAVSGSPTQGSVYIDLLYKVKSFV